MNHNTRNKVIHNLALSMIEKGETPFFQDLNKCKSCNKRILGYSPIPEHYPQWIKDSEHLLCDCVTTES